jgi:hypothetical protein
MKAKILIVTALLIGGFAWGQQDCSKIEDLNKRIKCLEDKIKALKLDDKAYFKGKHSEIVVDFSTTQKVIPLPQELKRGDFYQIRVKKINLNKWNVLINSADTTLTTRLSTPTFADLQLDALNNLVAAISSSTNLVKQTPEISEKNLFVNALSDVEAMTYISEIDSMKASEKEIKDKINNTNSLLSEKTTDHNSFARRIDDLKFNVAKKQLAAIDNSNQLDIEFNVENAIEEIEDLRQKLGELQETLGKNEKEYLIFFEKKKKEIESNENFKKADKALKERFSSLKGNISKMQEALKSENSIALLKSIIFLKDKDDEYISLPIQFKSELAEVRLQFLPKDSLLGESPRTIDFIFPTQKKSYWSVDASFYASSLYDESFSSITEVISENEKDVSFVEEDVTKAEIGVATLIRRGLNSVDPEKGIHCVFGPGISISDKIRPRLLIGGGYSIGKKHGFSIDFGGIAGYVERKSNAFNINDTLSEVPNSLTVSKLKVGVFIAFGYIFKL